MSEPGSLIQEIKSTAEFDAFIKNNDKVIVDFHAEWCGPCKAIAPTFEKLSLENRNVKFAKVNIDEHQIIASKFNVSSIPNFVYFKNGEKVHQTIGMNKAELETKSKDMNA